MKPALTHGHGPKKAIFMNGWLNRANDWDDAFEAINPATCEIAVLDYRGYGTRRDVPGKFDFDEAAQDVLYMADSLGWQRFAMVGHSMGGMALARFGPFRGRTLLSGMATAPLVMPEVITGLSLLLCEEREREVSEGAGHAGVSAVTQVVAAAKA